MRSAHITNLCAKSQTLCIYRVHSSVSENVCFAEGKARHQGQPRIGKMLRFAPGRRECFQAPQLLRTTLVVLMFRVRNVVCIL